MDEWGLEALELKAWMVILGTKLGENSDMHKLIGELGGFMVDTLLNIFFLFYRCAHFFKYLQKISNTQC